MANLKEVRERISSVITTQQITKAMKLVAASKLKKATDRIMVMRPYSNKLYAILERIMANVDVESLDLNFAKEREVKKALIVLITSDKGLCGGFNANLVKKAKTLVLNEYKNISKPETLHLMTLGKKGKDAFNTSKKLNIINTYQNVFSNLNFEAATEVADFALNGFLNGTYDKVHVVYSRFVNAATQEFISEQFLPIQAIEETEHADNLDFIFEPQKEDLVAELIPKILKTQFFRFLLDNNASEQGARMVAMDQATENANELLGNLKLQYNRERQAAITKEILEIVGGAAALEQD